MDALESTEATAYPIRCGTPVVNISDGEETRLPVTTSLDDSSHSSKKDVNDTACMKGLPSDIATTADPKEPASVLYPTVPVSAEATDDIDHKEGNSLEVTAGNASGPSDAVAVCPSFTVGAPLSGCTTDGKEERHIVEGRETPAVSPLGCSAKRKLDIGSRTSADQHQLCQETRHIDDRRPVGYIPEPPAQRQKCEEKRRRVRKPTRQRATGSFPRECFTHTPTLKELRSQSFTDYIRDTILPTASPFVPSDDSDDEDDYDDFEKIHEYRPKALTEGIAKVKMPDGFYDTKTIANDTSGRGVDWQAGTPLGDYLVSSPIEQNLMGLAGVYEYTFGEKPPLTTAAFREKADAYRKGQMGSAVEDDTSNENMYKVARKFWQRLGPTMPPAWYGADQEGTLFGNDPGSGWSIAQLDSCIHVLSNLPGVTSPYLYAGMWSSVFCAHTEDMNLMSINYLHAGAPKIWYAIAPGTDADRFATLCAFSYSTQARECKEFMRHKRVLISPSVLDREGIRYTTTIQRPGDAVITFPGGYHFGFNVGFNMAEATNFGVPEWIPYGMKAKVCMCRPDSVRIDMGRLIALLKLFQKAEENENGLSWKTWADRRAAKILNQQAKEKEQHQILAKKKKVATPKKEFWVIVTPTPRKLRKKKGKSKRKKETEEWYLAKPATRKMISPNVRVLIFLPGRMMGMKQKVLIEAKDDPDDVEEECFRGCVTQVMDNHVYIQLDGFPKSAARWIHISSPKLFLDGGLWEKSDEKKAKTEIGVTHFWREGDSKKLGTDL